MKALNNTIYQETIKSKVIKTKNISLEFLIY